VRLPAEMLARALELIAARLGLQFSESRRADLERCLLSACREEGVWPPEAYLTRLAAEADGSLAWKRLIAGLTVGETYFFRDPAVFAALERSVLPDLIAARRTEGVRCLRLWSAGCATGEEPYSLAILLDRLLPDRAEWGLTILATDINLTTLQSAMRGCYRAWATRETPPEIRDRYFLRREAETFELQPEIRRMVTFAPLNLAADGYPSAITNTSAMDIIFCRNVLMYLGPDVQRAVIARLSRALAPGGWLMVSPAEAAAELFRPLMPVNFPGTIFYRKEATGDQGIGVGGWGGLGVRGWGEEIADVRFGILDTVLTASAATAKDDGFQEFGADSQEARGWDRAAANLPADQNQIPIPQPLAPNPQSPTSSPYPPLLERARLLADQGNLEEARHLCDAALAKDRLNPRVYLLLAAIQQEQGEVSDALGALRRAVYLDPDAVMPHFLLGSLLLRQGKRAQGLLCMNVVTRLLSLLPCDAVLPDGDRLTAGRLLEMAREYVALGAREGERWLGMHRSGASDVGAL